MRGLDRRGRMGVAWLAGVLAAVLLLAGLGGSARAEFRYVGDIEFCSTPNQIPSGIAVNRSTGDIYVLFYSGIAHRFTATGGCRGTLGPSLGDSGHFGGIAINPNSGDVYFADTGNNLIRRFSSANRALDTWPVVGPDQVAVNPDSGQVYVYSYETRDVGPPAIGMRRFSATGQGLGAWGNYGTGESEFGSHSRGLAIDPVSGDVFVESLSSLSRFTAKGTFVQRGFAAGSRLIQGLAVDPYTGEVYVSGAVHALSPPARLERYSRNGALIESWPGPESGPGKFHSTPGQIAINEYSGRLYVLDGDRIKIYADADRPDLSPTYGRTLNVEPVDGRVATKCPGQSGFRELRKLEQIRVGCTVDTRKGTVSLTSARNQGGGTQTIDFWGGMFRALQDTRQGGQVEAALTGPKVCSKASSSSLRKRAGKKKKGKKGKSGKGRLLKARTKGKAKVKTSTGKLAAIVSGTTWSVQERCDNSSVAKVIEGRVTVRDLVKNRSVVLRAGQTYVVR